MGAPRWLRAVSYVDRVPQIWRCTRRVQHWAPIVRAYLQMGAEHYPIEFDTYSGVHLRLADFYELITAWVVFCRDEYTVPSDAAAVLDLGANYGAFTLLAATRAPGARIVSVEPYPATFEVLRRNVAAHGLLDRVQCWPLGVAGQAGSRAMSTAPEIRSHSKSLLYDADLTGQPTVMVESIGIEECLNRALSTLQVNRIDLVKIDIEGNEHEFLPDAPPELLRKARAWQMEYHASKPKGPLFGAFQRAGFECVKDIHFGPDYGVAHFQLQNG